MRAEQIAKRVIMKTYSKDAGIFWTGGKDSTVMLYLIRQLYPNGKNPVIFLDSGVEFSEVYSFIRLLVYRWRLNYHKFNYDAPDAVSARKNKIKAINDAIKTLSLKKVYIAIRRDEHIARRDESYISRRATHIRIHPILDFTEKDIWRYIKEHDIPYCSLYDKGYRSLGEAPFTKRSRDTERSGREAEKERIMQTLREMGYF